nr:hypothetical protein [Burkholderiales bacterium]
MSLDPARLAAFVEAVAALRGVLDMRRVDAIRDRIAFAVDDLDALDRATASFAAWAEPVPVAFDRPTGPVTVPAAAHGVAATAEAVTRGQRRAADVIAAMQDAAARWRHLNAWTRVDAAAAKRDAVAIDAAVARGGPGGALAGVP